MEAAFDSHKQNKTCMKEYRDLIGWKSDLLLSTKGWNNSEEQKTEISLKINVNMSNQKDKIETQKK